MPLLIKCMLYRSFRIILHYTKHVLHIRILSKVGNTFHKKRLPHLE